MYFMFTLKLEQLMGFFYNVYVYTDTTHYYYYLKLE